MLVRTAAAGAVTPGERMVDVLSTAPPQAPAAPRRRRGLLAAAVAAGVVAVAAVGGVWWAGTTDPLARGSGTLGVLSEVAPVAAVNAPFASTAFIATYVEGERLALRFPITSTSRLPVRITEVFPRKDRISCGWVPDRVETSTGYAEDFRPFEPFWLSQGETVDLLVSGVFGCGGRQGAQTGLTSYDAVPVRWSAGGVVSRTTRVPTGYDFGWTANPEPYLRLGVDRDAALQPR